LEPWLAQQRARQMMWRLAHHLVTERHYRLVDLFEPGETFYEKLPSGLWEEFGAEDEPTELFFVRNQGRKFQLVRLAVADFAWPRQLHEDLERLRGLALHFQQRVVARRLDVQNILLFPYPLIPEMEQLIAAGRFQDRKITVNHWAVDVPYRRLIGSGDKPVLHLEKLASEVLAMTVDGVVEAWKADIRRALERQEAHMQAVFSRGRPFWTFVLLGVNLFVFLLMTLTGGTTNPDNLIRYGAKYHPAIWAGEWWRFITPVFIHIGLAHLMFNSFALYFLGPLTERIYGVGRFLFIYFAAGAFGVAASFAFSPHLSAGASSAIFGLFGALLYFGQTYRDLFFQTIGMEILTILGINLVFGFVSSGVDNYAHLGGLVGGYLASVFFGLPRVKTGWLVRLGTLVVYVLLFAWLYQRGFSWMNIT